MLCQERNVSQNATTYCATRPGVRTFSAAPRDCRKPRGYEALCSLSDAVTVTGANRNTVKKHLAALVEANHLAQHGTGKGTWYGAP